MFTDIDAPTGPPEVVLALAVPFPSPLQPRQGKEPSAASVVIEATNATAGWRGFMAATA
jgi:hypothetical protein